jgi:16S rRNA C967 or C1407 C5-methylase (RsmB/RsmF family)
MRKQHPTNQSTPGKHKKAGSPHRTTTADHNKTPDHGITPDHPHPTTIDHSTTPANTQSNGNTQSNAITHDHKKTPDHGITPDHPHPTTINHATTFNSHSNSITQANSIIPDHGNTLSNGNTQTNAITPDHGKLRQQPDNHVTGKFKDKDSAVKFLEYLQQAAGQQLAPKIAHALFTTPPQLSIRLNPAKPVPRNIPSTVNNALEQQQVPWCPNGYYLNHRPDFTEDPTLHAGAYYVQEASSMFLQILQPLLNPQQQHNPEHNTGHNTGQTNSTTNTPSNPTQPYSTTPLYNSGQTNSSTPPAGMSWLNLLDPLPGKGNLNVLDLCAAPGGKSTHLISMLPQGSTFTANEVIKSRVAPLRENILKWGNHNAKVISFDARDICSHTLQNNNLFHFILVDAPCSGEGMFRKEPSAIKEWSPENVQNSAARQKRILGDIWPALAPGGYLAYTTCTFNIYENDQNVEWMHDILGAEVIDLSPLLYSLYLDSTPTQTAPTASNSLAIKVMEILEKWGIVPAPCGGYRFFPGIAKGEGLFFALLRKPSDCQEYTKPAKTKEPVKTKEKNPNDIHKKQKHLTKKSIKASYKSSESYKSGTLPGTGANSRNNSTPNNGNSYGQNSRNNSSQNNPNVQQVTPESALSTTPKDNYPTVELTLEQARQYLRCQSITLPAGTPLGMIKLTYGNLPLGYGKNIGTRLNNLYPKNWRIRKDPTN